jgi:hypothetical protein
MTNIVRPTINFDPSNQSAFGTLETNELQPIIGIDFVYGINTQVGSSTVSGTGATVDTNASRLRIQSGTSSTGTATYNSRRVIKYRPGQGITARFTAVFATGTANNTQVIGVGNATEGYFFGYNGTAFGIAHRNNGSTTWTAQTAWNGDKADGTGASAFNWNKQFGNVCMIKYPYLGYGDITFYVQDSVTAKWVLVHTIRYANTSASVQITNPNLYFWANITNSGNTSNRIMYVGSVGIFLSGTRGYLSSPKGSADSNLAGVTTETNILSLRNATTYNTVTSRSLVRLTSMSVGSSAANGIATFKIIMNTTLGGSPAYTPISGSTADNGVTITSGNSAVSFDVAGTTITGGTKIFTITVDNPNSTFIDLIPYEIFIPAGEILTVSGTSTVSSTLSVALNWVEDL